ncbi:hypothetical protein BC830DRAFT_1159334 [Chytriomyces sp. MP71]|nr:hypothetical protein BC830DRAFT_1159334 [Chytriomyces sp. MP71]
MQHPLCNPRQRKRVPDHRHPHHATLDRAAQNRKGNQRRNRSQIAPITASVSFLLMMTDPCTFNVLAYRDKEADVPMHWIDSHARMVTKKARSR